MKIKIYMILTITLLLVGCKDKEYYELAVDLVNPGQLLVHSGNFPPNGDNPVLINSSGQAVEVIPGEAKDVEEGTYFLTTITPRAGLVVDGTEISLPPVSGKELPAAPEFSADIQSITVMKERITEATIALKPMTRTVSIKFTTNGFAVREISSIKALLFGVAGGKPSGGDCFTSGVSSGKGILLRILGIVSDRPYIAVEVATVSGKVYSTRVDVSKNFAEVTIELVKGVEGISGSIVGWKPGPDVEIDGEI